MKMVFGIGFLVLAGVLFLLAALGFWISHLFESSSDKVGRAPATRQEVKHQKDATLVFLKHSRGIRTMHVPHLTKTVYTYTVGGKEYRMRNTDYFSSPSELPWVTTVFYVKRFPKIRHLKEGMQTYSLWAFTCIVCALCCIGIALKILL